VGNAPPGGENWVDPVVPETFEAKLRGTKPKLTLMRTALKVRSSVSTRFQVALWGPLLVHPFDWPAGRLSSPGVRIWYPKMEATKESTRITTARIRGIC